MSKRKTLRASMVVAATAVLMLSACGGDDGDTVEPGATDTGTAGADQGLADRVPDEIKADGKISIGVDATYAPAEYLDTDGQTVIGFDVEIFDAVAERLGLDTEWVPAPFGAIITGVESGKYEIGVSSFTINDERKQQVNMVSYFNVGTQWFTKAGNPAGVDIDNACGKRIAVQKDTVQVEDLEARSQQCTAAGQPAIVIDQYQGQDQATAAVVSGKDDAGLADYPVAVYAVQQTNGQLEILGQQYEAAPYGYAIKKDQTDFAEAVAEAVNAIIEDGTYQQILEKYELTDGAVDESVVNP